MEESLNLIEQRIAHSSAREERPQPKASKNVPNNCAAVRIMTNWYERNSEHPYPSYETAEVMAKAGGITVEQVKKWFANRRLRLGHTKHITQIAKRRKRSRSLSKDDILLTGSVIAD